MLNGENNSYNRNHAKEINTVRGNNSVFEGQRLAINMVLTLGFKGLVYKNAKLKYFLISLFNDVFWCLTSQSAVKEMQWISYINIQINIYDCLEN
jgi:hypothetical protein